MPARSEWKGFLQVNQLRVPVKAFSAASTEPDIALHMLHRDCGQRLRQHRQCPVHGAVEQQAIVSGYEVAENCYLAIEPSDVEQLRPESDKSISVQCFIDPQTIDPVFHTGRTLYLVPDGPPGQRPFTVLRDGMRAVGRHAFSRFVIYRREQLAIVRPHGRLLALTFLEYAQHVRPAADYESEVSAALPGATELELARQLIESMTESTFELQRFRDRYVDALTALIEERVAQADLTTMAAAQKRCADQDDQALLSALTSSLRAAGVMDRTRENSRTDSADVEVAVPHQKSA